MNDHRNRHLHTPSRLTQKRVQGALVSELHCSHGPQESPTPGPSERPICRVNPYFCKEENDVYSSSLCSGDDLLSLLDPTLYPVHLGSKEDRCPDHSNRLLPRSFCPHGGGSTPKTSGTEGFEPRVDSQSTGLEGIRKRRTK